MQSLTFRSANLFSYHRRMEEIAKELLSSSFLSLFKTKNYAKLGIDLEILGNELMDELKLFDEEMPEDISQKDLLETATQFCATLTAAVFLLTELNRKLQSKASGAKYSLSDYTKDYQDFNVLRNTLQLLGTCLQNLCERAILVPQTQKSDRSHSESKEEKAVSASADNRDVCTNEIKYATQSVPEKNPTSKKIDSIRLFYIIKPTPLNDDVIRKYLREGNGSFLSAIEELRRNGWQVWTDEGYWVAQKGDVKFLKLSTFALNYLAENSKLVIDGRLDELELVQEK